MSESMIVFDRATVRRHRDRAARGLDTFGFLFDEVADRLADRLDDVTRSFPLVADLGGRTGSLARLLTGRKGIETVVTCDISPAMAAAAPPPAVVCDEEFLPFAPGSLDLIVSNLSLHWVNDLPGLLVQARRALRPDGLFLAAMLGGDTLRELRDSLAEAEIEGEGGLSPRVSPMADVRDCGGLLQRAGFALPVVDSDTITVTYETPLGLMRDLRGMGESNAVAERRKGFSRRATLLDAARRYADKHADAEGRVPATFQIIWLTAWAPSADQPKALKPGSAVTRLEDALKAAEQGLDAPERKG
ncbi:methyltransferase domain-containing protein [Novispirillum sp. DQ9]|uniref:methyltransferase domain-containing protein n=1 Tax=Novispirillum sp. DQ9 TaxID=3398612 RepID=UPI003C7C7880